jgi:hypothetical protein
VPCTEQGLPLPGNAQPPPRLRKDGTVDNPYSPFPNRPAFELAHWHFAVMQTSARNTTKSLDLIRAWIIYSGGDEGVLDWETQSDMLKTIDLIQEGNIPWKSYFLKYEGPLPENPPSWMLETYELITRDVRLLIREQIASATFDGQFDYCPYQEFDKDGNRRWSNLLSAVWAWTQAVSSIHCQINIY